MKFLSQSKYFHWQICAWKYRLPKWRPSCPGLNVLIGILPRVCDCFGNCFIISPAAALITQKAKFLGRTWGPPGSCRPQLGPMLEPCYQGSDQWPPSNIALCVTKASAWNRTLHANHRRHLGEIQWFIDVNINILNFFVDIDCIKPSHEPILPYHERFSMAFNREQFHNKYHCDDVIMTTMAAQITILTVVYSTVYSDANQRKHQSSASLAFVWGIHRDRWIPRTKGQLRGKCFHLMTSSWT